MKRNDTERQDTQRMIKEIQQMPRQVKDLAAVAGYKQSIQE
jgi:hypothetical protein